MEVRPILFVGKRFAEVAIDNMIQAALHFETTLTVDGHTEKVQMPLVTPGKDEHYVFSTDSLQEGLHYLGIHSNCTFQ